MLSNCTVEKIIHENVEELIYVTDIKYIVMILVVLVGLKLRKQCKNAKSKSQTMAWTFYFLSKKNANWPLYFMSFQRSDEPTSKREQPPSCHGDIWRGLCRGREWGGVRFWGCQTSLPNLPRVIPFTNHVTYFVIKKFNVWEVRIPLTLSDVWFY